jgi:hypothetical protein
MTTALRLEPQPLNGGRSTKFTPERIQQICNLVERGRSRDEIAEIIGVTTGTLKITCSKLGISLRRQTFNIGTGLLRRQRPPYQKNKYPNQCSSRHEGSEAKGAQEPLAVPKTTASEEARAGAPSAGGWQRSLNDEGPAVFAIRMQYKGQERSTGLPLDDEMIGQLAIEAEIRGMRIGEFVAALILAIMKKDLFHLKLEPEQTHARGVSARVVEAGDQPKLDRIIDATEDDRDRRGCSLRTRAGGGPPLATMTATRLSIRADSGHVRA